MIQKMQETGFHSWGFVIYRGYYEDEEIWKRYLKAMERAIHEWLVFVGREDLLPQYLRWTIIEDETLVSATIRKEGSDFPVGSQKEV